jgi:hypothetical protein
MNEKNSIQIKYNYEKIKKKTIFQIKIKYYLKKDKK